MVPEDLIGGASSYDALLALTAMLFGLAIAVQVIQELYKHLSSSKARAYRTVLRDTLGSWVDRLYEAGPAVRLHVRGPFQFFRSKPSGVLLPMSKDELLEAMDIVAPDWMGYTLQALKTERKLQQGGPAPPSPHLLQAVQNLEAARENPSDEATATRMLAFLEEWGEPPARGEQTVTDGEDLALATESPIGDLDRGFDAARALEGFVHRFFPDRVQVEQEFAQISRNFEHAYERRNLRQTFTFAFVIALALGFPLDAMWERANELSTDQAVATATQLLAAGEELGGDAAALGAGSSQEEVAAVTEAVGKLLRQVGDGRRQASDLWRGGWDAVTARWSEGDVGGLAKYVFFCLLTAIFVSFGAPFWHRLSTSLLHLRRQRGRAESQEV